jgi:hypothetical protein
MSYQPERDEFVAIMAGDGMDLDTVRAVLRAAATIDRLAVAVCNGDYPADNGERKTRECPECAGNWSPGSFRRNLCPSCRVEQNLARLLPAGFKLHTSGDPRGYCTVISVPSGRTSYSGCEGVCVPTRER